MNKNSTAGYIGFYLTMIALTMVFLMVLGASVKLYARCFMIGWTLMEGMIG